MPKQVGIVGADGSS